MFAPPLDTFTRIGALRTDRRTPSILHRLLLEGAALPQLRASSCCWNSITCPDRLLYQILPWQWATGNHLFSKETKVCFFSPITDTRGKAHQFLKAVLQILPRIRTVESQCAKIWNSRYYPAQPGVLYPCHRPGKWGILFLERCRCR